MRVLITGHKGYIGTVMVPIMMKAGFDVVGMDSDLYRRCTFNNGMMDIPGIEKDIRDATVQDLKGFDAVCHLAALSNDPLGNLNPEITYDINFRGTVHLAEVARAAGVRRFVFSSSCSNYGSAGDNLVTEDAPMEAVTPYGVSKVKSEKALAELADRNFVPVFLRNATAYGLSPRHRFDIVLNNLTAWAYATGRVYLKSDGTPWRPIVHIADITQAFMVALTAPSGVVSGQAFNIGRQDQNYRIRDIAQIVQQVVPDCRIEYAPDAGPDTRCYRVDFSKAARLLSKYQPEWTARRGAEELYDAYRRVGLKVEEFEGARFNRIDHIKKLLGEGLLDETLRWTGKASAGPVS
ncbi:NAD-dependent dehydratase [candidate division GN15 bacterium]|uniref:NAD-dependent dehydratase n=1 Tax=candidate division GN15 bacterium TaxID=2072418 RepID=A0A855X738_9BACT|nr:MAG: NAD-dependent dehydratase [candidate division GN15 bacterium]